VERDPAAALARLDLPVFVYRDAGGALAFAHEGSVEAGGQRSAGAFPLLGQVPALPAESLGDPTFLALHRLRYPYIAGALAAAIGSTDQVIAMARAGMIGFFGAGGLDLPAIERALHVVKEALPGGESFGFNLLSNPVVPEMEMATVELYLRHGVERISASAYMRLSAPLVYFRAKGLSRAPDGSIRVRNHVFAKLSRTEVARAFLEPAPERLLQRLVEERRITAEQAELARTVPVAEDVTVEADSGGHTDNRPALPLLSAISDLRDQLVAERGYTRPVRVGAAGGVGTPTAVAASFLAGAAYVLTGSVNQSCREAGTSDLVKRMLCEADVAAVDMAPASRRAPASSTSSTGRTAASRRSPRRSAPSSRSATSARRSRRCGERRGSSSARAIPRRSPRPSRARSTRWRSCSAGTSGTRRAGRWVWCGPAMGAFNEWAKGSFLEGPEERTVVQVAKNLLFGAARLIRARMLAFQGVPLPPGSQRVRPHRF
jgi:NAD(P)H-dependent flavin oxidoreductase YrpB (nitropropane dioxygenase family)